MYFCQAGILGASLSPALEWESTRVIIPQQCSALNFSQLTQPSFLNPICVAEMSQFGSLKGGAECR
jgi:hypothetical protein